MFITILCVIASLILLNYFVRGSFSYQLKQEVIDLMRRSEFKVVSANFNSTQLSSYALGKGCLLILFGLIQYIVLIYSFSTWYYYLSIAMIILHIINTIVEKKSKINVEFKKMTQNLNTIELFEQFIQLPLKKYNALPFIVNLLNLIFYIFVIYQINFKV